MKSRILFAILAMLMLLAACVPASTPTTPAPGAVSTPELSAPDLADAPEAATRVRDAFAASMGKAVDAVAILSVEEVEWPDSCLGAAAADEMCAAVITPGYRIVVENEGEQYTLHTDAEGNAWRVTE